MRRLASIPRPSWLCGLFAATLVLVAVLAAARTAEAQVSEEFAVRIAARLNADGRIEFGIQRIDDQGTPRLLHLEWERFFPRDVDHHRWLHGTPTFLLQAPHYDAENYRDPTVPAGTLGTSARVIARISPDDGRVEFALEYKLDLSQLDEGWDDGYSDPVLASRRFFPEDVTHHRWLYGSEIRFTRVWAGDESMEPASTLDTEDGEDQSASVPQPQPTLEECLTFTESHPDAMPSEQCGDLLWEFCKKNPEHAACPRRDDQG